jgi:hypothetical protein
MRKASLYHGIGMTVSNDGNNDPVCTLQWPFPAIICNDYVAGDNAIEFGIASGTDCWIVPGSNGTDTTFGAFGAIGNGSTLEVTPTSAGLGSTVGRGGYTLCNALGSMVAGVTKIRAARVGKIVTVWQWDGSNWVKFIEVNLATQSPGFANQTVIQSPMLGILYGTSQATINNVWTGTYVP